MSLSAASSGPQSNPAPAGAGKFASWLTTHEGSMVYGFALLLFALNLTTGKLYPTSWVDEAQFSDPAINFAQGKGFVSTAWWLSSHTTWSGNVPLYSALLVPWVKLFGVGLVRIRAFNYLILTLVIPVFWLGIKRLGCVPSAVARVALMVTAFLSFPLCFPYRSARTDVLGMLILAWALCAWTSPKRALRNACLFAAGFLMPTSGLQLIGYFGLMSALIWLWEGRVAIPRLGIIGAGIGAGLLALFLFYYCNHLTGIIDTIRETRQSHEDAVRLQGGQGSVLARLTLKLSRTIHDHTGEYGVMPTMAALVVLLLGGPVLREAKLRNLALIAIAASFALVGALELSLHYLAYYHWMNYSILVVTAYTLLARAWDRLGCGRRALVILLLGTSVAGGLPLRLFVSEALHQRQEYAELQELVEKHVQPTDVVFSDYMGYFPVKQQAHEIYVPAHLKVMTEEEKRSINVLVLDPINFEGYSSLFVKEGKWTKVASFSSQRDGPLARFVMRFSGGFVRQPTGCGYSISIVRRESERAPSPAH